MNTKLRPIIKWTGGKYDEFALFSEYIPSYKRYIEPFFGGGGVFFALQPKVKTFINDKSTDLINFYKQVSEPTFKTELLKYVDVWDEIAMINTKLWICCSSSFIHYIESDIDNSVLSSTIKDQLDIELKFHTLLNDPSFMIDIMLFNKMLMASMVDKAKRIKRICLKEGRNFNQEELKAHFETGIRSGVYLFFRALLNKQYLQILNLSPAKAAANWYFVREFCYGAMFRFNAKGEFNIPYGGIAYNKKNFRQKAQNVFNDAVINLFKQAKIYNLDFEQFLKQLDLKPTDFIFLDPPYDSEFSEYDQSAFTSADQVRLARLLIATKSKWMVVIKETEFIRKIYTNPAVKIVTFNKNYTYNVRGRNERGVTHLIITNY